MSQTYKISSTILRPSVHISVGILYDCQRFLCLCAAETFVLKDVKAAYKERYHVASLENVLSLLRDAHWMTFAEDGTMTLTKAGRNILDCRTAPDALRAQISDIVFHIRPSWSALVPRGRNETLPFVPADMRQCFREAGVVNGYSDDVLDFWDGLASIARGRVNDALLQIGRVGERLSIAYEAERTGLTPAYTAVDSNLAGFDLLSVVSHDDFAPLKIEVKACNDEKSLYYFLSQNEWSCAIGPGNWALHVWMLKPIPVLKIETVIQVESSVPSNRGAGSWQSVKIYI